MGHFLSVTDPLWKWVAILATLAVSVGVLATLHLMPNAVRRAAIVLVTFIAGGIYVLAFLVPPDSSTGKNFLANLVAILGKFAVVVLGFTILLGIYHLCRIHSHKLARAREGWAYSLVFFISFLAMLIAAF